MHHSSINERGNLLKKLVRSLSQEGQTEFGHIFKDGNYIPVKQITPIWADLQGHPDGEEQLVFLADWTRLSTEQQTLVLTYLSEKFTVMKPTCKFAHAQTCRCEGVHTCTIRETKDLADEGVAGADR